MNLTAITEQCLEKLLNRDIKDETLAKNNYSYEKRQKDIAKKKKQEEKRQKKLNKGSAPGEENTENSENPEADPEATPSTEEVKTSDDTV